MLFNEFREEPLPKEGMLKVRIVISANIKGEKVWRHSEADIKESGLSRYLKDVEMDFTFIMNESIQKNLESEKTLSNSSEVSLRNASN